MTARGSSLLSNQKRIRTISYAREIRSSLRRHGTLDIQGLATCLSCVLKGNRTAMRMSKAEIKMETLKWRMYSGREEAVEARKRYGKRESQGSKEEKGRFAGKGFGGSYPHLWRFAHGRYSWSTRC